MMSHERVKIGGIPFNYLNGAWIAEDTIIGKNLTVLPGAVIGRPPISVNVQTRQTKELKLKPLQIGDDCIIGANVVIYRGTTIGNNCLFGDKACVRELNKIGDSCVIAMGVTINYNNKIGSRIKVMDNTHLTGNMIIEDDVFIGPLVSTTNDNSMGREAALGVPEELRNREGPILRRHATIGQGACLLPGIKIGENSTIGANSVVTKSIPACVIAFGIPARVIREMRDDEIKA